MNRVWHRWSLGRSYAWCERLARRSAGNFFHAFRLLPTPQRRAMCALYAFLRIADDLGDGAAHVELRRDALARWRGQLLDALAGDCRHPIHPALRHAIAEFAIPVRHLFEVLDGIEMDLTIREYKTFDELYRYCYHVASAVGLACVPIWGCRNEKASPAAEAAGIAFQLTNILRDVGEDAARGRVYIPQEDLARFGCRVEALRQGICDEPFRALMRFEARRAYGYYDQAGTLTGYLEAPGRGVFLVMLRTYRGVLDAIAARDFDVFSSRVGVRSWYKLWLALRSLPVCWGWLSR